MFDPQLQAAAKYYEDIKRAYAGQDVTISFTGHSLGGGLAALMGVFFNKEAKTFDPAPFRLSATSLTATALQEYLVSEGFQPDDDLAGFSSLLGIRGEEKVSAYVVADEILTNPVFSAIRIYNPPLTTLDHANGSSLNLAWRKTLHSQSLLVAFEANSDFRQLTYALPQMLVDVFDRRLFAEGRPDEDGPRTLIDQLIRHQFG